MIAYPPRLTTVVVTVPYLIYYLMRGDPVFIAMAFNIALVTGVMVRVLMNSFVGFTTMIRSKEELVVKQQEPSGSAPKMPARPRPTR